MAQGKPWKKEEVIELLKPFFKLGMNVNKACASAGIPQSTVQTWIGEDDLLRLKIEVWQKEITISALKAKKKAIERGDKFEAGWWLERKEKDDFSLRQEMTGKDGKDLVPSPMLGGQTKDAVPTNNSDTETS